MTSLVAGAAAHNAGQYDVAGTIWAAEAPRSPDSDAHDSDDRLLDGLAAFAAAVTGSRRGDWPAAIDAADEAELALSAVDDARADLAPIRRWLAAFDADPETAERSPPPTIGIDGDRPLPGELPLAAAATVASAVAAARGDDPELVADALRFAREDDRPETTRYATFLRDYAAAGSADRAVILDRLAALVDRERRKETDVEGLFGGE